MKRANPKFKARTEFNQGATCPWCEFRHSIYSEPELWDSKEYDDKEIKCRGCGHTFFLSLEIEKNYIFTSSYKPLDEWEREA